MPGPLDELLLRAHAQRDTPGGDQAWRDPLDWYRMWSGDPGIYGAGAKIGGNAVMPPQAMSIWDRQAPIYRNVMRDIERRHDPVLTGSGLEMTAEDYRRGGGSALDQLLRSLQERPALMEYWR